MLDRPRYVEGENNANSKNRWKFIRSSNLLLTFLWLNLKYPRKFQNLQHKVVLKLFKISTFLSPPAIFDVKESVETSKSIDEKNY